MAKETNDSQHSRTKKSTISSNSRRAIWAEKTRRDPSDPYAWAMTHRSLSGRPLRHIPALADIARDDHPIVIIQKSSQAGISELLINLALWAADTHYG